MRTIIHEQNKHIRMISEGSCDTENWSKTTFKYIYINKTFTCISQYYCLKIALILLPLNIKINAACVSIRKKLGMHRFEHFGR